jgi:hypothetical protein
MSLPDGTIILFGAGLTPAHDLGDWVQSITVDRGRNRELDPPRAGTCEFVLRNDTGFWNPGNTGASLAPISGVGTASPPATLLVPGKIVVARAGPGNMWIFVGRIRSVDYDYRLGGEAMVRVLAEDGLAALARRRFSGFTHPEQSSGQTVRDVLTWADWATEISAVQSAWGTFDPAVGTSTATVVAADVADLDGRNVLDYLADLEASEQGRIFVANTGMFVAFGRYSEPIWTGAAGTGPAIEFTDTTTTGGYVGVKYRAIRGSGGGDVLYTQVVGQSPSTGTVLSVTSAGAATYGTVDLRVSGLLNHSDAQTLGVLTLLSDTYGSPAWRVDGVEVKPYAAVSGANLNDLLELDLHQTVRVKFTPVAGSAVSAEYRVQRITHRITPGDHVMTVGVSVKTVNPSDFFVLGSSALGGPKILGY